MNTKHLDIENLAKLIQEIKIAMLTTVGGDGAIHTRPMVTPDFEVNKFDGTLWFFSRKSSQKNHCIEKDQHVNLAYANPDKHHYASISGRAVVSHDRSMMEALWNPSLKTWFPQGLSDPELSLIGVSIDSAEIWDTPVTKTAQMLSTVKSAITGKPYEINHNSRHVDLQSRH